jgi:hypothetical protein
VTEAVTVSTARSTLVEGLRYALADAEVSQARAARCLNVKPVTVYRWLRGESPINVEAVLRSRRLSTPFVRYLTNAEKQRKTSTGEAWFLSQGGALLG